MACQQQSPIFAQGDAADAVFYIQHGQVKLSVVSTRGKEAVIALLEAQTFFGEGCLAGQPRRMATATALTDCSLMRIEKPAMLQVLHAEPAFSALFVSYLLSRNIRIEADLIDQLFNSSEKWHVLLDGTAHSFSDSDAGHRYREQSRVSSWQEQGAFEDSDLMWRAHTWPTRRSKPGCGYGWHYARTLLPKTVGALVTVPKTRSSACRRVANRAQQR